MLFSFHLLSLSNWPIIRGVLLFFFVIGTLSTFSAWSLTTPLFSLFRLILLIFFWWRDVTRESTLSGYHTSKVIEGIKIGFILFIYSEIMFFIRLFWGFFRFSLVPDCNIGFTWPPINIPLIDVLGVPLINTLVLLLSGTTLTISHLAIKTSSNRGIKMFIVLTIILGILFTYMQIIEYKHILFSMSNSCFGSIFYTLTGFHGLHVLLGTTFLLVVFLRIIYKHLLFRHHIGFELSAWYWHFVDVVWLIVYIFIYCWTFN